MGNLDKEIDSLFDTWLAKWKPFRRFLAVLRTISYEFESIDGNRKKDLEHLQKSLRDLRIANSNLQEQIDNLKAAPTNDTKGKAEGYTSARSIMDEFHASQQVNN
jgi:hypothetical protein